MSESAHVDELKGESVYPDVTLHREKRTTIEPCVLAFEKKPRVNGPMLLKTTEGDMGDKGTGGVRNTVTNEALLTPSIMK